MPGAGSRLDMNHVGITSAAHRSRCRPADRAPGKIAPMTAGAGSRRSASRAGSPPPAGGRGVPVVARFSYQPGSGVVYTVEPRATELLAPLDAYAEKVVRARRRGPGLSYELNSLPVGDGGSAVEYDLDASGVPVDRPSAARIVPVHVRRGPTPTELSTRGHRTRYSWPGDPVRSLVRWLRPSARIIAARSALAEERRPLAGRLPRRPDLDGFGTENVDWVARAPGGSSSSPRMVTRSISSSRDQRRCPALLELPRRRCSCHRAASS